MGKLKLNLTKKKKLFTDLPQNDFSQPFPIFRRLQRVCNIIDVSSVQYMMVCDGQLSRIPSRAASECREWTAAARVAATIMSYSLLRYFVIETTTTTTTTIIIMTAM